MGVMAMILIIATGFIIEAVFDILQTLVERSLTGFILRRARGWSRS